MSILEVHNVSIRYMTGDFKEIGIKEYVMRRLTGNYKVVEFWADRDVNFTLEEGEMLGIIGTNGAGKSTLLKAVSGIMEPTKGYVRRRGTTVSYTHLDVYKRQCLDSVLQQTLREIEIICVDDGSNDGSPSILREYQAKDERVRIVSQENQGLSSARNIAMKKARGEFIYYIDSDDYLETDALEELYSLSTGNSLDAVFFDLVSFYDGTGKIRPSAIHRKDYARVYDGVSFMRMLKDDHAYITSACLMMTRREFLLKNGISFYEGIIHEDELFCWYVKIRSSFP